MEVDDEANCSTDPDGLVHKASVTKKRCSQKGLKQQIINWNEHKKWAKRLANKVAR